MTGTTFGRSPVWTTCANVCRESSTFVAFKNIGPAPPLVVPQPAAPAPTLVMNVWPAPTLPVHLWLAPSFAVYQSLQPLRILNLHHRWPFSRLQHLRQRWWWIWNFCSLQESLTGTTVGRSPVCSTCSNVGRESSPFVAVNNLWPVPQLAVPQPAPPTSTLVVKLKPL